MDQVHHHSLVKHHHCSLLLYNSDHCLQLVMSGMHLCRRTVVTTVERQPSVAKERGTWVGLVRTAAATEQAQLQQHTLLVHSHGFYIQRRVRAYTRALPEARLC